MAPTDASGRPTESARERADADPAERCFGMAHLTVVPANFDPETHRR